MDHAHELQQDVNGPYYNVGNNFGDIHQAAAPLSNKRKSEDKDGTPDGNQGRAKRNRYISIACNECKRRKIRCNGNTPCERCHKLHFECVFATNGGGPDFKDSEEYRRMSNDIHSLQEQVNHLYAGLEALRNGQPFPIPNHSQEQYPIHPALAQADPYRNPPPSQPHESQPRFHGPTSSAFSFDVARSSLQTMGITAPEVAEGGFNDEDVLNGHMRAPTAPMTTHQNKDPLWKVGKNEAIRLCGVYEEEMGLMYPILDMEKIVSQAKKLFDFTEAATKSGLVNLHKAGPDTLGNSHDKYILRMVLATALIVEGEGQSVLGRELYESCQEVIASRLSGPVEIGGLIFLVLVADYYFQQDEEASAHRILGLASRQCLEIGLHRRENLMKVVPNSEERSWAIKLFWSIYVLDRRWGFGTGMPFTLQDDIIDPSLPEPDDSSPYLTAMISYSRISSKVWTSTNNYESPESELNKETIELLDYQILQWHNSIPESLRFHTEGFSDMDIVSRGQRRLQVILYLRTNQARVSIYKPVLISATNIMAHRDYAQTAVDVAKDTIRTLTRLNEMSDIYRRQQVTFNYFLISALAILFLAVAHAPAEFNRQVRDEFYMALDLVKGFSTKSYTAKRLWKCIKDLKEIGPKLGVISRQALADPNDPHSSAAVAMAGLAGHQVDEMAAFHQYQEPNAAGCSPMNGQQITQELTHLFENAGGHGNNLFAQGNGKNVDGSNGFAIKQAEATSTSEGSRGLYRSADGEFSKIMGNLV